MAGQAVAIVEGRGGGGGGGLNSECIHVYTFLPVCFFMLSSECTLAYTFFPCGIFSLIFSLIFFLGFCVLTSVQFSAILYCYGCEGQTSDWLIE